MRIFLDSSALAKRYVQEKGTEIILERCASATEIILSVLCIPEIVSAFNRLRREEKVSTFQYHSLKRDFIRDVEQVTMIEVTPFVLKKSIDCLEQATLRSLDAIQVASAIEASSDLFLSADRRQCHAAVGMKLKVERV